MDLPIKCCDGCLTNYTLKEWATLQLRKTMAKGSVEIRICAGCGNELELSVEGLADLDLTVNPQSYAARHPYCSRVNRG